MADAEQKKAVLVVLSVGLFLAYTFIFLSTDYLNGLIRHVGVPVFVVGTVIFAYKSLGKTLLYLRKQLKTFATSA